MYDWDPEKAANHLLSMVVRCQRGHSHRHTTTPRTEQEFKDTEDETEAGDTLGEMVPIKSSGNVAVTVNPMNQPSTERRKTSKRILLMILILWY